MKELRSEKLRADFAFPKENFGLMFRSLEFSGSVEIGRQPFQQGLSDSHSLLKFSDE